MNRRTIYIFVLAFLVASALTGCATAKSPTPAGIETAKDINLPITVENVWYRTDKVRLLGLAYEESGTITVGENGVKFVHENGSLGIRTERIQKVVMGKLWPDITNEWVIVYYIGPEQHEVAAFKEAVLFGSGTDSKIYSALGHIMKTK